MKLDSFNQKKKNIPEAPGVYFFLGRNKKILYIGKAAVLQGRLRSYFSPDLVEGRGERIVRMIEHAVSIDWRTTDSVLEALILESNLIKTHKPEYNILAKDDKTFNYVVITEEKFPRVLLIRGKELELKGDALHPGSQGAAFSAVFGPFPHGMQLRIAMKIIRRIFPYRDSCTPCLETNNSQLTTKKCRACFNRQIGLCPGVCTGEITKAEYGRTIRHIKFFFQGKKKELLRELMREMKKAAKEERFEDAGRYKRQIFALQHIQDVALIKDEYRVPSLVRSAASDPHSSVSVPHTIRIEAYDIAHFRGSAAYGVMTVVENGERLPDEYRLFKIRSAKAGDDPGALREILSRRLAHDEWPMPRLIVVDGATAQLNAAEKILLQAGIEIPVIGVVKDAGHRPREIRPSSAGQAQGRDMRELIKQYERDVLLANAEAHRFAIARHRKTLRGNLTRKGNT